jgi:hypothetical protein
MEGLLDSGLILNFRDRAILFLAYNNPYIHILRNAFERV